MEGEMEKSEILNKMERGGYCIFEGYRFLNIFLTRFLPNKKKKELLEDPSFLSSEEEYEDEGV